jgi:tRNA1(Val) A37 N6-methylase TrmN6
VTSASHKLAGFVATPEPIAQELVNWAIRDRGDSVLDVGAGEGIFLLQAARRLLKLGADIDDLPRALHGVEKDPVRYQQAASALSSEVGVSLPGIRNGDLFHSEFPAVTAIVGNPPYVRRASVEDVDGIQSRIIHNNLLVGSIPRLTDLYVYFLMYAERFLIPGGRLAVVVSSSWLDTRSGEFLKRFILDRFRVHAVVASDVRLFQNALVKSVLLLAEKGPVGATDTVRFARLRQFYPGILTSLGNPETAGRNGLRIEPVRQGDLRPTSPWSVYLRTPGPYFLVASRMGTTLGTLVESRIGIQPLARDFFVLTTARARAQNLPEDQLQPIAYSPRHVSGAVISEASELGHRILSTRLSVSEMSDALRGYIHRAEEQDVPIRGKGRSVRGFHNVPRLQQASREPWYNLHDEIERRGRYTVFLPRRFYETFVVVWNRAGVIAGENFIELRPKSASDTLPLLAILNSSFFETVARCHAQQYGGGIFNLNPLDVKRLPVFTLPTSTLDRERLTQAFLRFAESRTLNGGREALDELVAEVFGYSAADVAAVREAVTELRALGSASKGAYSA